MHDWLAHLTDHAYQWNQYDASLKDVICTRIASLHPTTQMWILQTFDSPLSLKTLYYKHQIFADIIDKDIFTDLNYAPVYALIATMISKDCVFTPLGSTAVWDGLDGGEDTINLLRLRQPVLKRFSHQLAMRDDVTPDRLIRDHGMMSALCLLYGLCLTSVILIHAHRVQPDPGVHAIIESLSHTLASLKGVFDNVESQWLSPHV